MITTLNDRNSNNTHLVPLCRGIVLNILSLLIPSWGYGKLWDLTEEVKPVVLNEEQLLSYNNDPRFEGGLNTLYFQCQKPCKITVVFRTSGKQIQGMVDILWGFRDISGRVYFPTYAKLDLGDFSTTKKTEVIPIYADSYVSSEGFYFEPRIYGSPNNIIEVKIRKTIEFKDDKFTRYVLFLMRRAKTMIDLATLHHERGDYGGTVYFSKFCIEFSIKSLFPAFGKKFPRTHHPESCFSTIKEKILDLKTDFPMQEITRISREQDHIMRRDFYGMRHNFSPAYVLFDFSESSSNIRKANMVFSECQEFLDLALSK